MRRRPNKRQTKKRAHLGRTRGTAKSKLVVGEIVRAAQAGPPSKDVASRLWGKVKAQLGNRVVVEKFRRQNNPAITAAVLHAFAKERDEVQF